MGGSFGLVMCVFVVCSNVFIGAGILSLTMQSSVCGVGGLKVEGEASFGHEVFFRFRSLLLSPR